jgi:pimeloyl-ACP methyl ester carboxylesterase
VQQLLEELPRLREIVSRKAKPPPDDSGSGWDHFACCEGIRSQLSDGEIFDVVRYGHGLHGERKDDRYVWRTIDAAHGSVDSAKAESTEPEKPTDLGAWIADQWRLEPAIVEGHAIGAGGAAIIYLTLADGRVLRFPRLGELFDVATHVRQVSLIAECECPSLKSTRRS